jgi:hypothetical protein
MTEYVVNELLCVLKNKHALVPRANIVTIFTEFYTEKEITEAKQLLSDIAEKVNLKIDDSKKNKSRVGEVKVRRDVDDICSMYAGLESKDALPRIFASNTSRIPSFDATNLTELKLAVDTMSTKFTEKIEYVKNNVTDKLATLTSHLDTLIIDNLKENSLSVVTQISELKSSMKDVATSSTATFARVNEIGSAVVNSDATAQPGTSTQWKLNNDTCWSKPLQINPLQNAPPQSTAADVKTTRMREALASRRSVVGSRRVSGSSAKITASSENKLWHIYIGRLGKDTTEEDLKSYLEDNSIIVSEVRKLKATQDWQQKSSAYRVSIAFSCKDIVMDDKLWPNNVDVRDWFFKPKDL